MQIHPANDWLMRSPIFDREPLTVTPDTPVLDAIALMDQGRESDCVLVVEGANLLGIFTERDAIRSIASGVDLAGLKMVEVVVRLPVTISVTEAENPVTALSLMHQHQIRHLPVVDEQGGLVGLIAQTKLLQALEPLAIVDVEAVSDHQQLELALQASESKLSRILDSAITAISSLRIYANRDWEYEYWSAGCERLYGYSLEELADKYFWISQVFPDDREQVLMPLFDDFFAEREVTAEYRFRRKDGSMRWFSSSYTSQKVADDCWIVTTVNHDITERKQAKLKLQQQLSREQLIAEISQDIRRSLELNEVLSRTVERVRDLLTADRVIIFRFHPDWQGEVISESVGAEWTPILSTTISDPCFRDRYMEPYRQGRIATLTDIESEDLEPCYVELMQQFQVRANLVVPILQGEHLWGLLIAHHCSAPRQWQPSEIDLLRQLATQVGIAIQQSELYEQTRQELLERQRIQAVLEESEERFRTLSAAAPIGICQANADGICLYVNESWQKMSGLSLEDSLGNGWLQAIHPADRQALLTTWEAYLQGEGECLPEFRLSPLQGEVRWVAMQVAPIASATGEIIGHVSTYEDITERKQAEVALRQQLEREQLLAEVSNRIRQSLNLDEVLNTAVCETRKVLQCDRVFIYRFHPDWSGAIVVESVGDGYPAALGAEIADQYFQETHGEDYRQGRIQAVANIYEAGLTQCHVDLLAQFQIQANLAVPILQGRQLWGLLVANQCAAPRVWQPAEIYLVEQVATQLAIAIQQSELYQQLRASEQRLQAILDNSPAVIYLLDPQNRHLLVNRTYVELFSTTPENLLGKSIYEVWPADIADAFAANNRQVLQENRLLQTEEVAAHPDGLHTYLTLKFPLHDPEGKAYAIGGISTDITAKKQLQEQFYRAQRLESLGTLASGIAHDLNNVLTPILAIAQLLPLKFPDVDERTRELLTALESSAKRGADMVRQILAFTRGQEGNRIHLQVAHLISEVVRIARRTFPKAIEISANLPAQDPWLVCADATQLHQVFMNLMVNARDAMPDGGSLAISAENFLVDENYARMNLEAHAGPYVVISISDTGTGIPPERLERIFDPFFTTKEVGTGTGLGLATVLGIVKNHGGFLQVSSTVGQGSQFRVYLPATEGNGSQLGPSVEVPRGQGELILVVDDEANVRQITKTSLEDYNYRVLLASDGIEAIALYAEHKDEISAVLMDLMMPNLDGWSAIRTLQKMNPQVKIIATSGLPANPTLARSAAIATFLPKPYTIKDLMIALDNIK
jgi:PAS domain S-box-containing protein